MAGPTGEALAAQPVDRYETSSLAALNTTGFAQRTALSIISSSSGQR